MKAIVESVNLSKAENGTIIRVEYKIEQEPTPKNPNPYPEYRTKTAVSEKDLISEILDEISEQVNGEVQSEEVETPAKPSFNPKSFLGG